jgi:hypothetical protein
MTTFAIRVSAMAFRVMRHLAAQAERVASEARARRM